MPLPGSPASPAGQALAQGLAAAARRRRAREVSRTLWRAAPAAAAAAFVVALGSRLAGAPDLLPLGFAALALLALLGWRIVALRASAVDDRTAREIDAEAALGGELRSARWFAGRGSGDAWTALHLERASARLAGVDWAATYPPHRAPRARAITAAFAVAVLVVLVAVPRRVVLPDILRSGARADVPLSTADLLALPPELQARLAALLAAAGTATTGEAPDVRPEDVRLRELLDALSRLGDREALKALARAMAPADAPPRSPEQEMQDLAERAREAAASGALSPAMQDALEKLADELEIAKPDTMQRAGSGAGEGDPATQDARSGGAAAGQGPQELSLQFAKEAAPAAGSAMMMMGGPESQGGAGAPGAGVGGGGGSPESAAAAASLAAALKLELVESARDAAGANTESDLRRRTDQGDASAAFTRSRVGAAVKARAASRPLLPESRRTDVQQYFRRDHASAPAPDDRP